MDDHRAYLEEENTARGYPPSEVLRCSFCNKSQRDVMKLIAGPSVLICDECVDICLDIIAEDRVGETEGKDSAPGTDPGADWLPEIPEELAGYIAALAPATQVLHVGSGEFQPVPREVFEFEVSGFKVVQSWLSYRMRKGAGKKSSPLDDIRPQRWTGQFTTELLEVLWVLEATVAGYSEQAKLLEAVTAGPCFHADELPHVPDEMRTPPPTRRSDATLPFNP